jgi:hypothetical protein
MVLANTEGDVVVQNDTRHATRFPDWLDEPVQEEARKQLSHLGRERLRVFVSCSLFAQISSGFCPQVSRLCLVPDLRDSAGRKELIRAFSFERFRPTSGFKWTRNALSVDVFL